MSPCFHSQPALLTAALALCWLPQRALGQWQSVDGGVNRFVHAFEYNADTSKLIVGGSFPYAGDSPLRVNNLATWDGWAWSNEGLGNGNGDTSQQGSYFNNFVSLALLHDTLFAGAMGSHIHYHPEWQHGAGLHNDQWFSIGDPNTLFWVIKVNDRLFCGGQTDTLYGQFMPGIKEWIGGAWQNIPNMPLVEPGSYYCGTYWHGQYWFAGSFIEGAARSVIAFDGVDQWTPNWGPGGGWIRGIAGFGDSLYVGGWYPLGSDSESPMIQIWGGNEWQPFFPDVLQYHWQIFDIEVYQGALYVSGDFHFIDDPSTPYSLLRFDGHEICAIGGVNMVGVNGQIAFFQGDLYMALASEFPGLEFEYIGKLPLDGLVPDRCVEVVTGVPEQENVLHRLGITPNPTEDFINISHHGAPLSTIELTDAPGRVVLRAPWRNEPLDVRALPGGVYQVRLRDEHARPVANGRFVKR